MLLKFSHKKKMAIIPMAVFLICVMILKSGMLGNESIERPAQASVLTGAGNVSGSGSDSLWGSLSQWRETRLIKSRLNYHPEVIRDMTLRDLKKVLGEPALHRVDGSSRMVQYISEGCAADFYYRSDNPRIAHYEFRSLNAQKASNQACRREIFNLM